MTDTREWQDISTAPKIEGKYLLGFDSESAEAHGDAKAGVCVLYWMEPDEDFDGGWEVRPFSEGLDCIEWTNITHWMPLPLPPAPQEKG